MLKTKVLHYLHEAFHSIYTQIFILIMIIFVLFSADVEVFVPYSVHLSFIYLRNICFFLFSIEIILALMFEQKYFMSLYFFMDVIDLISLATEASIIWTPVLNFLDNNSKNSSYMSKYILDRSIQNSPGIALDTVTIKYLYLFKVVSYLKVMRIAKVIETTRKINYTVQKNRKQKKKGGVKILRRTNVLGTRQKKLDNNSKLDQKYINDLIEYNQDLNIKDKKLASSKSNRITVKRSTKKNKSFIPLLKHRVSITQPMDLFKMKPERKKIELNSTKKLKKEFDIINSSIAQKNISKIKQSDTKFIKSRRPSINNKNIFKRNFTIKSNLKRNSNASDSILLAENELDKKLVNEDNKQSKKESKVKIKKETASLVLCEKQKIQEKIENLKKKYSVSIDEKENQMNKNTSFNTQQYQNTLIGATIQSISSNYNSIENTANKKLSINLNSIIINQENNENYTITEESLKPNANRNIINTVSSKEDSVLSRSNRKQSLKDYNKPLKRIYNRAQTHDNLININNLPNKIIPEHRKILSENKNISNTFRSMKSLNLFASVNKFNPFEEKTNGKKINKFALIKGILKLTPDQLEKYIQGESKNNNYILEDHSKYLSKELKKNLQDIKFQQFISASCIGARIHNNNTRSIFIDYNQFLNNNDYKKAVVRNSSQNVIETEASQVGKSPLKKPINVTTFSPLKIEKNKKVEKFASLFSSKISYLMSKYNLSQEDFDYNMNSLESLKNDVKAYEKELSLAEMKGFYKKIRNKKLKHLINFEQFKGDVCSLNIAINNLKSKGIDYWNIFSNNINKRNDKIDQLIFKVRSVNI